MFRRIFDTVHYCFTVADSSQNRPKIVEMFPNAMQKHSKKVSKTNPRRKSIAETFVSPKRWNVSVLFQHSFIPKRSNNWWNIRQSDAGRSKKKQHPRRKNRRNICELKALKCFCVVLPQIHPQTARKSSEHFPKWCKKHSKNNPRRKNISETFNIKEKGLFGDRGN